MPRTVSSARRRIAGACEVSVTSQPVRSGCRNLRSPVFVHVSIVIHSIIIPKFHISPFIAGFRSSRAQSVCLEFSTNVSGDYNFVPRRRAAPPNPAAPMVVMALQMSFWLKGWGMDLQRFSVLDFLFLLCLGKSNTTSGEYTEVSFADALGVKAQRTAEPRTLVE